MIGFAVPLPAAPVPKPPSAPSTELISNWVMIFRLIGNKIKNKLLFVNVNIFQIKKLFFLKKDKFYFYI
jgi:hypothetical protein